jgi:hypothetical protein
MQAGRQDRKHQVLITGAELRELKRLAMPESFGLDRRIERYQGTRPIGLYRWDLECLLATTSAAASGRDPFVSPKGRVTLQTLHDRIQVLYQAAYGSSGE